MSFLLVFVFSLSWVLTWFMRYYALSRNILDIPNHRSSHMKPTPRGGGMAFVAAFLIVIPLLAHLDFVTLHGSIALLVAGLFLAILGFLDDQGHISVRWRLIGHFAASCLALYWVDGMPAITFFAWTLPVGPIANVLAILYLVWLLNLYNFMDGIDGLAGVEAVSVCMGIACLYWFSGDHSLMVLPLVLAAAVAGFLVWNFPPARIFMGDAGSGFLGFIIGVLSIQAGGIKGQFFWSWLILLGFFVVDATVTLFQRAFQGDKIYEAHRSHAYQNASSCFGSHLSVTLSVAILNIVWLWPFAIFVGLRQIDGLTGLLIAYLPLVILALQFKAGKN